MLLLSCGDLVLRSPHLDSEQLLVVVLRVPPGQADVHIAGDLKPDVSSARAFGSVDAELRSVAESVKTPAVELRACTRT